MTIILQSTVTGTHKGKPVSFSVKFPNVSPSDMAQAAYSILYPAKFLQLRRLDWTFGSIDNGRYALQLWNKAGKLETTLTFSKPSRVDSAAVEPATVFASKAEALEFGYTETDIELMTNDGQMKIQPGKPVELFPGCVAMTLGSPEDVPAMVDMIAQGVGESPAAVEPAKPQTIYLLTAEHFSVPGFINKPFASLESATFEAIELINIMLKDSGWKANATAANWEKHLERLQDYHGAAHCFVEINPAELRA